MCMSQVKFQRDRSGLFPCFPSGGVGLVPEGCYFGCLVGGRFKCCLLWLSLSWGGVAIRGYVPFSAFGVVIWLCFLLFLFTWLVWVACVCTQFVLLDVKQYF